MTQLKNSIYFQMSKMQMPSNEQMSQVFNMLDTDKNGKLDLGEIVVDAVAAKE